MGINREWRASHQRSIWLRSHVHLQHVISDGCHKLFSRNILPKQSTKTISSCVTNVCRVRFIPKRIVVGKKYWLETTFLHLRKRVKLAHRQLTVVCDLTWIKKPRFLIARHLHCHRNFFLWTFLPEFECWSDGVAYESTQNTAFRSVLPGGNVD